MKRVFVPPLCFAISAHVCRSSVRFPPTPAGPALCRHVQLRLKRGGLRTPLCHGERTYSGEVKWENVCDLPRPCVSHRLKICRCVHSY